MSEHCNHSWERGDIVHLYLRGGSLNKLMREKHQTAQKIFKLMVLMWIWIETAYWLSYCRRTKSFGKKILSLFFYMYCIVRVIVPIAYISKHIQICALIQSDFFQSAKENFIIKFQLSKLQNWLMWLNNFYTNIIRQRNSILTATYLS